MFGGLFFLISSAIALAAFGLWIWMLIECLTKEPNEPGSNDKLIWFLVVFFGWTIGALIYFFVRRPERIRNYGR